MTVSAKVPSGGPTIPESQTPDRDYPQMVGQRGLVEPAPRRVRGYFDGTLVFDTIRAHYVWEIAYYPQYYIPMADVRMEHLKDENHVQKLQLGSSRLYSLTSPERIGKSAARLYDSGPVAGSVRFEWDALDWFEEDEPIIGHPRNPYIRVDALRSHRHIRVELDAVVLARQTARSCFSRPDSRPVTTSTAPTSRSRTWRQAKPKPYVLTKESPRSTGRSESERRCIRISPGPTTIRYARSRLSPG